MNVQRDRSAEDRQAKHPVVVLGGTGGTGYHIVQELLQQQAAVRILSRRREKAESLFGDSVEIAVGDVSKPETLRGIFTDAAAVFLTVGVKPGRVAESKIKAIEYQGTANVLQAAEAEGFDGRFLYMGAIGTDRWSPASGLLNWFKGNTLKWRQRAEQIIRDSGVEHTIIHAGVLSSHSEPHRPIRITQRPLRMWPWRRIGREDVARVFTEALHHSNAAGTTFDAIWGTERDRGPLAAKFEDLVPDTE